MQTRTRVRADRCGQPTHRTGALSSHPQQHGELIAQDDPEEHARLFPPVNVVELPDHLRANER
jgi:hypothetical protein